MGCGSAHAEPPPPEVTDVQNTMNASATSATAMRRARGVPQWLSQTARPLSQGKNATHTTGFASNGSPRTRAHARSSTIGLLVSAQPKTIQRDHGRLARALG